MNSDFKDLLRIFDEEKVEYLVVGAYAVMHHSQPRYTKDIDLWIKPSVENAARVAKAFDRFDLPLVELDKTSEMGSEKFVFIREIRNSFLFLEYLEETLKCRRAEYPGHGGTNLREALLPAILSS